MNPFQLAQIAQAMAYLLDQDGTLVEEHERHRRRDLRIQRRPDGSAQIEGELTALCAEALLATLEPFAAPVPAGQDGAKDPRSYGQRLHDALYDAALIALRSQQLPDCGGVAATIVLHLTPEQIHTGTGLVTTGHGAQISVPEALTLFGDARIFPVVLGNTGEILAYGSARRHLHRRPTPGHDRPRPRLLLPRLHPTPGAMPVPSHHRLRHHPTNHRRRRHPAVWLPPPRTRGPRLDLPHDQRHPPLDATPMDRPDPDTTTQPSPHSRTRLRIRAREWSL